MSNKRYGWIYLPRHMTLELGAHYMVYGRLCRFIKVTAKGYNFLNERTNKCIFPVHLYDKRYRGPDKPVPGRLKQVETMVNKMACIERVKEAKTA